MGEQKITVADISGAQTVYTSAPEWTAEDREGAVGLMDYEASLCSGCGNPLEETSMLEREFAYRAEPPILCHYCVAVSSGQAAHEDHPHADALHFPVKLRE